MKILTLLEIADKQKVASRLAWDSVPTKSEINKTPPDYEQYYEWYLGFLEELKSISPIESDKAKYIKINLPCDNDEYVDIFGNFLGKSECIRLEYVPWNELLDYEVLETEIQGIDINIVAAEIVSTMTQLGKTSKEHENGIKNRRYEEMLNERKIGNLRHMLKWLTERNDFLPCALNILGEASIEKSLDNELGETKIKKWFFFVGNEMFEIILKAGEKAFIAEFHFGGEIYTIHKDFEERPDINIYDEDMEQLYEIIYGKRRSLDKMTENLGLKEKLRALIQNLDPHAPYKLQLWKLMPFKYTPTDKTKDFGGGLYEYKYQIEDNTLKIEWAIAKDSIWFDILLNDKHEHQSHADWFRDARLGLYSFTRNPYGENEVAEELFKLIIEHGGEFRNEEELETIKAMALKYRFKPFGRRC